MKSLSSPAERGRRLEQHIAAYFSSYGYVVQSNQVLTGRSGGRHEIDVLAEKTDPLTSFRIAVECKAWSHPIEKDVVSKLHYVMTDLGIHKGVVVSLAGVRTGAQTAAAELGIDVWGPDELRRHLGESVFADVAGGAPPPRGGSGRMAYGWPFGADASHAHEAIRREGKGRLGLRTLENTTWFAPIWVPAYLLRLTVAQPHTKRLRQQITSVVLDNAYEALGGGYIGSISSGPVELPLADVVAIKPKCRETQVHGSLRKAVEARQKVTSTAAVERHNANLRRLGLPVPCQTLSIDQTILVHLPAYAGLLQTTGQDRMVAVDGITGMVDPRLSQALTSHLAHVRASFG